MGSYMSERSNNEHKNLTHLTGQLTFGSVCSPSAAIESPLATGTLNSLAGVLKRNQQFFFVFPSLAPSYTVFQSVENVK